MNLIYDDDYWHYPGYFRNKNGTCRLRVWESDKYDYKLAIVTEVDYNPGPSITNCAEKITDKLDKEFGPHVLIENYGNDYDYVRYAFAGTVRHAKWSRVYTGELTPELLEKFFEEKTK